MSPALSACLAFVAIRFGAVRHHQLWCGRSLGIIKFLELVMGLKATLGPGLGTVQVSQTLHLLFVVTRLLF